MLILRDGIKLQVLLAKLSTFTASSPPVTTTAFFQACHQKRIRAKDSVEIRTPDAIE
jgi:hypothetical protein